MGERKSKKKDNKDEAANARPVTTAAAEAAVAASRRRGLGLMLAVLLAGPALSAGMSGDMSPRHVAVRLVAAVVAGRLAVELVARVVTPRGRRGTPITAPVPPSRWRRHDDGATPATIVETGSPGAPTGSR